VPRGSADLYLATILDVCRRFGVRAIFPGSEPELAVLSAARGELAEAGVVLMANTPEVIEVGLDKQRTAQFLESQGFRPPRSALITGEDRLDTVEFFPAVLKPNTGGGGSANVYLAQNRHELQLLGKYLLASAGSFLVQEYVGTFLDEYTVGVLSGLDGTFINSIAVRRNIMGAFSSRLRVPNRTENSALDEMLVISNGISQGSIGPYTEVCGPCERIAAALRSRGPLNIQCRLEGGVVRVFEINPRFSGTASLRAMAGFNEPDLLYRRHVEGEAIPERAEYRKGIILRGLREGLADPALGQATQGVGDFQWTVPPLPFIFRPLETPHNPDGIPDTLKLTLGVDRETGLLRQVPHPAVSAALARAYQHGSEIPGMMEAAGIGKDYADDFLEMLAADGSAEPLPGKRVLEIGCGTGYLLSRLKELGASVLGIEPGPHGQLGPERYGVPVIRAAFPTDLVTDRFDLVVLYLVVEHLPDGAWLPAVRERVGAQGRVALVVPDAEPFLHEGDGSILFHEHYSYFTAGTLSAVLRNAGAVDIRVRTSRLSRLLFATFGFGDGAPQRDPDALAEAFALAHRFRHRVGQTASRLAAWLAEARNLGESVAVYVPGRFVNYIALGGLDPAGLRFIDDSPALTGRYFPGIDVRVETQDDLVARPTDRVLIMSRSFGGRIRARLTLLLPATTRVTGLDELTE
jgi:carbamoyl-phosphate synthase large subunit